jgi:hypothetical protein
MKRAGILGLAIVLTLGLGVAVTQAKPKKVKIKSEIEIDGFDSSSDPPNVTFFGDVDAKKAKCERKRKVNLEQVSEGIDAGSDKTDSEGDWEVTFDGNDVPPGDFQATVKKRRIKQKQDGEVKKIFICKKAVSPVFSVKP